MKLRHLILGILLTGLTISCSSNKRDNNNLTASKRDSVLLREDFKKYFDDCRVEGSIAIYDNNNQNWILSDTVGVKKETLPASTFKINNLLIALETKTISDENEVIK